MSRNAFLSIEREENEREERLAEIRARLPGAAWDQAKVCSLAWDQAKVYLAAGNLIEADNLREHMLKSDARLMKERIEKADPNFYANKTRVK